MQTRSQTKRLELELLGPPSPLWPLSEQFPGARHCALRCAALRCAPLLLLHRGRSDFGRSPAC